MTCVLQLAEEPRVEASESLLKSLHFMMTHYDLKDSPGRWRSGAIFVRDEEPGKVVHEGAEVEEVPACMAQLCSELNQLSGDSVVPPIIRAAMDSFHLDRPPEAG